MQAQDNDIDKLRYGYFFHDVNGKINYRFSDKSRLFFSVYMGKDKFYGLEEDTYTKGGEWNPDENYTIKIDTSYGIYGSNTNSKKLTVSTITSSSSTTISSVEIN